jgi:DNA-binding NtrC family response regulator
MTGEKRILLVDDDSNVRDLYHKILTKHGYNVSLAINGQEALQMINKAKPHLVISDYSMPVMDGFSFLKEFRSIDNKTPVIILTGTSGERIEDEAKRLGANDFLNKGVGIGSFLNAVSKFTVSNQATNS